MKTLNVFFILLLGCFLGLWFWTYAIPSSHLRALADVAQQELVEVSLFSNLTATKAERCCKRLANGSPSGKNR